MQTYPLQTLPLLICYLTLFLPNDLSAQKDHFKAYIKAPQHEAPIRMQGNQLILHENGKDMYVVGELKAAAPDYQNYAFVTYVDAEGTVIENFSLKNNTQNLSDGVRGASIALDKTGNIYVGGGYTGNWNPLGTGSERTLSSFNPQGKIRWSQMQSSFYYAALAYDEGSDRMLSLSGPTNLANPAYNLQISQFAPDGKIGATFILDTPGQDYAQAIEQTGDGTFAFAGTSIIGGKGNTLVGQIDQDLKLQWAFTLANTDLDITVSDLAYHSQGVLGISGTIVDIKDGTERSFMTLISTAGELLSHKTYVLGQSWVSKGLGIAAYDYAGESGFLLTGFYVEEDTLQRRSFLLRTDLEGEVYWAKTYSDYSPEDNTWDEVLRDVIYVPADQKILALGDVSRYKNGVSLDRKALVLVKAGIATGELNEGESCYEEIPYASISANFQQEVLVQEQTLADGVVAFGYQQPALDFNTGYCSFGADPDGGQGNTGTGITSAGEELEINTYHLYKVSPNTLRVEADNFFPSEKITLELWDLTGRKLKSLPLEAGIASWNLYCENCTLGMYFVRIQQQGRPIQMDRFILGD